ncbi:MAG: hypothetical protein WC538_16225 [Thermoanaerobaculia bacterium]
MENPREIAKYVKPGARVVSVGVDAAGTLAATGASPASSWDTAQSFLAGEREAFDLLLVSSDALTADLLASVTQRQSDACAVAVVCNVDPSRRLLDSPGIAEVITLLSGAAWSIVSPGRWLDRAERSPLLVVARPDDRTIRSYERGDEAAILDLFEISFSSRRPVDWWRWEYADNPHGALAISLAFDRDGLAAQYAGYPVPLWSRDPALHGLTANQVGDTMTAVRVRSAGRGPTSVLVRTAKHFFAAHCAGKVAFNYGFNTANIRKISTSYNESAQVEQVPFRRAGTAALQFPGRMARRITTLFNSYTTSNATSVDGEWDGFLDAVAPSYGLLVRRDARYLKWRYLDHPELRYEIVALRSAGRLTAWSVFRRRDDTLIWGDALVSPRHARAASLLLLHALESPVGAGVRFVECWFPKRPAFFARALDALGLAISPEPHDLALMCTPFLAEDAETRLARDFYYAACDSDLY